MRKGRLEAFSDGVLAIIITIMVLELKAPHSADPDSIRAVIPAFLSYILSFIHVGIYWNNHHHLFHVTQRVNGLVLWANLHLLFWLSLIPFVTSWMGESHFGTWPVAAYGVVLIMCAASWELLSLALIRTHEADSALVKAMAKSGKEWLSLALYAIAIGVAFVSPITSCLLYAAVAAIWFIPDLRIEREIKTESVHDINPPDL